MLEQTYTNWELLIVIDAASSDKSGTIAKLFADADNRIKVLRADARGVSAARNVGLDRGRGDYFAFLDSDDQWLPDKLDRQIEFMKLSRSVFTCTAFRRISEGGQRLGALFALRARLAI